MTVGTREPDEQLRLQRHAVADLLWEQYDFPDGQVVEVNGWATSGDDWSRVVFVERFDTRSEAVGETASRREVFCVRFRPGSTMVVIAGRLGQEIDYDEWDRPHRAHTSMKRGSPSADRDTLPPATTKRHLRGLP